jgi:hypothetical protein
MADLNPPLGGAAEQALSPGTDRVLLLADRFRSLILTSPLWLAAILFTLSRFGGPGFRNVIQFLTASPLR